MKKTNKHLIETLVSPDTENTAEQIRERNRNRKYIRAQQKISLNILKQLEILNWSQRQLADKMKVSPQQVNKWVKGTENYTLNTLIKIGEILDIELVSAKSLSVPSVPIENKFITDNTEKITTRASTFIKEFKKNRSGAYVYGKMQITEKSAA